MLYFIIPLLIVICNLAFFLVIFIPARDRKSKIKWIAVYLAVAACFVLFLQHINF
jgi:EamA domain-containing membrane protein RarD